MILPEPVQVALEALARVSGALAIAVLVVCSASVLFSIVREAFR